jgi:hypothetical protein
MKKCMIRETVDRNVFFFFYRETVSNLNYAVELSYSYQIHMIMINTNINYRTISYKNKVKRR